jgi:murein DD-endopeptidase MepM/ murein hydrolase activator NlpD
MKRLFLCLVLNILLISSCATYSPFPIGNRYGGFVNYGDGYHAGIDYSIREGTPIIASSEGEVSLVEIPCASQWYCGGIFVEIHHADNFNSDYGHLKKVYVKPGQVLKRGQLIGLSGDNNRGYAHLHFVIFKDFSVPNYRNSFDPDEFWLGGRPQCFDPNKDYASYSPKEITLPIACGGYERELISKIKSKD